MVTNVESVEEAGRILHGVFALDASGEVANTVFDNMSEFGIGLIQLPPMDHLFQPQQNQ